MEQVFFDTCCTWSQSTQFHHKIQDHFKMQTLCSTAELVLQGGMFCRRRISTEWENLNRTAVFTWYRSCQKWKQDFRKRIYYRDQTLYLKHLISHMLFFARFNSMWRLILQESTNNLNLCSTCLCAQVHIMNLTRNPKNLISNSALYNGCVTWNGHIV